MASSGSSARDNLDLYLFKKPGMVASCFELISVGQQEWFWSGSEGLQWMASVFIVVNVL